MQYKLAEHVPSVTILAPLDPGVSNRRGDEVSRAESGWGSWGGELAA